MSKPASITATRKGSNPLPAPVQAPAAPPVASAPLSAARPDPGPPPSCPAPPNDATTAHPDLARQLYTAAAAAVGREAEYLEQALEHVHAVQVFRAPAAIHRYKAEILAWLEERKAFFVRYGL